MRLLRTASVLNDMKAYARDGKVNGVVVRHASLVETLIGALTTRRMWEGVVRRIPDTLFFRYCCVVALQNHLYVWNFVWRMA